MKTTSSLIVLLLAGAAWAADPPKTAPSNVATRPAPVVDTTLPKSESLGTPEDEKAIIALIDKYTEAWNKKDHNALGALFAVDADFSSIYGQALHGRAIIAEKHGVLFQGAQKESQQSRSKSEMTMRFLKPDVVALDSVSEIVGVLRQDGTKTSMNRALTSMVLMKTNGKWEIVVFHNMLLPYVPPTTPPTGPPGG